MKIRIQFLVIILSAATCYGREVISEVVSKVALSGKISHTWVYGPPNFGENPESDAKEQYWLLALDRPIQMKDEDGAIIEVAKVQLIVTEAFAGAENLKTLNLKQATASGDIFLASTGHHHEKAVLVLNAINQIGK